MENITITGKTWIAGKNTLVLTIQKTAIQALQLKKGSIIQAVITKIPTQQREKEEQGEAQQTTKKEETKTKIRPKI